MSATFAGSSSRSQKATCPKCKRTVHVVVIDGVKIETDTELITVIPFEVKPAQKIFARRAHSELCTKYQIDLERHIARHGGPGKVRSMKWIDLSTGRPVNLVEAVKRPVPGKREPGQ